MDWFSSHCTDVTHMERLVQTVALPEIHTVLGMEIHVLDILQPLKGKVHDLCCLTFPWLFRNSLLYPCLVEWELLEHSLSYSLMGTREGLGHMEEPQS